MDTQVIEWQERHCRAYRLCVRLLTGETQFRSKLFSVGVARVTGVVNADRVSAKCVCTRLSTLTWLQFLSSIDLADYL